MTAEEKKAVAEQEEVKEEEKKEREYDYIYQETAYEEDTSIKTRFELVEIACRLAGVESPELMMKAFD